MKVVGRIVAALGITAMSLVIANPASVSPVHAAGGVVVIHATHSDTSAAVPKLRERYRIRAHEGIDARLDEPGMPGAKGAPQHDPVVQRSTPRAGGNVVAGPQKLTSWDAINIDQSGCGCLPPDTNAEVSAHYVVETVNTAFAVYAKDGTVLLPSTHINAIWSGFGGACEQHNDGDPVVLYDHLADRWMISQFTVTPPYNECIAISRTGDPTGEYYRYAFQESTTLFADYPHFGIWPDAYYMATNNFDSSDNWAGSQGWAFDRAKMLVGDPSATLITLGTRDPNISQPMLPADVEGAAPDAGTAEYFLEYPTTTSAPILQYRMHVDFATAANSYFSDVSTPAHLPTALPIAPFSTSGLCDVANGRHCVPQPGTTQKLDAIADRFLNRLVYRRLMNGAATTKEALLTNMTVNASNTGAQAAPRWFEIDSPNAVAPTVAQDATYAPDAAAATPTHRWMGSVSMDREGNILLGYSASSTTTFPSIKVAGQQVGDPSTPANTLGPEVSMFNGTASQFDPGGFDYARWGDYSNMQVDPSDGCTFWYSQEYVGSSLWATRVGAFRFPNCDNTVASMTASATSPASAGSVALATFDLHDAKGFLASTYRGTVCFTTSDPNAQIVDPTNGTTVNLAGKECGSATPYTYAYTMNDSGTKTFKVIFHTTGAQTLTATETTASTPPTPYTATANVLVNPAAQDLSVTAPSSVYSGHAFTLTATALDAGNAPLTTYAGTVHFTSSDPKAVLPGDYTYSAADLGSHDFSVTLVSAGAQTVTVTDTAPGGVTNAASVTVNLIDTFVTPGGNDAQDCMTPATACERVQSAINKASPGASVTIAPGTYHENITIDRDLTINGAASNATAPNPVNQSSPAGNPPTPNSADTVIDGGGTNTVVIVLGTVTVNISGLTITNGNGSPVNGEGGGIINEGTLTLSKDTISNNHADTSGNIGGGIFNDIGSVLKVYRSTLTGNTSGGNGGAIQNYGPLTVANSTIVGNTAGGKGGAIRAVQDAIHVYNSTIDGNTAATVGGAFAVLNSNGATLTMGNDIVAKNVSKAGAANGPDCNGTVVSDGHNLVGDGTACSGITNGTNGDTVGSSAHPTNPQLGPLADNGGPTQTQGLASNSSAIDGGSNTTCGNADVGGVDQRGLTRPNGLVCDVGALETHSPSVSRVARFTAARHGSVVTFRWHLAVTEGVLGFNLTRGSTVLNTHLIAVHASPSYSFRTHLSGAKSGVKLTVLLKDGGLQAVALSR